MGSRSTWTSSAFGAGAGSRQLQWRTSAGAARPGPTTTAPSSLLAGGRWRRGGGGGGGRQRWAVIAAALFMLLLGGAFLLARWPATDTSRADETAGAPMRNHDDGGAAGLKNEEADSELHILTDQDARWHDGGEDRPQDSQLDTNADGTGSRNGGAPKATVKLDAVDLFGRQGDRALQLMAKAMEDAFRDAQFVSDNREKHIRSEVVGQHYAHLFQIEVEHAQFQMYVFSSFRDQLGKHIVMNGHWQARFCTVLKAAAAVALRQSGGRAIMVDVGAGIGFFSLHAASFGLPVYAYEPFEDNLTLLNASIRANDGFGSLIQVRPVAVDYEPRPAVCFKHHPHHKQNVRPVLEYDENECVTVPAVPLGDELTHNHHLAILKISVNGYEHRVWKSLQLLQTLATRPPCVLFVAIQPDDIDAATPSGQNVDDWGARAFLLSLLDAGYKLTYEQPDIYDESYDQRLIEVLEFQKQEAKDNPNGPGVDIDFEAVQEHNKMKGMADPGGGAVTSLQIASLDSTLQRLR
ncbi:hypothetical protein CAOG_05358 [Capsaspora owczarzaki ATCC 30864]|uniref:Methyltransferase FkbM domain-containing protein n=1 Tax=Capsaspora owczarzaki (strain ATCC 30864) TaxID=595528 RepID=A0A0D2WRW0_CAPO3|nr:hypothetical protein CAOG_05358 [Capsaspora owczarzaki ATCC 30864]KJE94775.1 hypothetical protein CAOG_005358 [Capsaspora owczarzaki ATCC 30864]|eukprot:XP_004347043.1 hypothetical protein CAOG_05358 [Capsaspora owczarzaki ATCC 30864]